MFGDAWNPWPIRLNPDALGLDGQDLAIARIIAEETEAQREREIAAQPPLTPEEAAIVVEAQGLLLGPPRTRGELRASAMDLVPWDSLLRQGEAHSRAAARAELGHVELIEFAIAKCHPTNWEALFWYQQWVKQAVQLTVPWHVAKALVNEAHEEAAQAKSAHERSIVGGSKGGRKSAETRRRQAKVPDAETLENERARHVALGTEERYIAGKLAKKYGVTPTAIREKMRKAEKRK